MKHSIGARPGECVWGGGEDVEGGRWPQLAAVSAAASAAAQILEHEPNAILVAISYALC
jgi:hypothetical protein